MEKSTIYSSSLHKNYFQFLLAQRMFIPSSSIHEIDAWVKNPAEESAFPVLLVSGTSGCGKSSLLIKWMEFYTQSSSSSQDLLAIHFVGLSQLQDSYFSCLYQLILMLKVGLT
jgi:hypothetical protein